MATEIAFSKTQLLGVEAGLGRARPKTAGDNEARFRSESVESASLLVRACEAVFQASGVPMLLPNLASHRSAGGKADITVDAIAKASGMRIRRVELRGSWWERDAGPLLAWRGLHPIALLPLRNGGYRALDPATASSNVVDGAVAREIDPTAYLLCGAGFGVAAGLSGLVRHALHGSTGDLLRAFACSGAAGLLGLAPALMTAGIFGSAIPDDDRTHVLILACGLAISAVCAALFNLSAAMAVQRASIRTAGRGFAAIWNRVLMLPVWFFREYDAADLVLRVFSFDRARETLSAGTVTGAVACLFSLVHIALLAHFAPSLTLPALALVGLIAAVSGVGGWVHSRYCLRIAELTAKTAGRALEFVQGVAKLRVAGAESRAFASWSCAFADGRREAIGARRVSSFVAAVHSTAPLAGWTLIAAIATSDPSLRLHPAALLAFTVSFQQLLATALEVSALLFRWSEASVLAGCTRPLMTEPIEANAAAIDPGPLRGAIEARNLRFRYEPGGAEVLRGVSFRVEPGEFVAFVGASGGGKSTVLRLLLGFERGGEGSITYDGQELSSLDLEVVRRQCGVVLQDGHLFPGTIAWNILGASGLDLAAAWRAAEMAHIADEIRAMPMGMATQVSERGAGFSGGQRQRILIARALVHSPRILLLDEATSALDNRTQAAVAAALDRLGVTRIVIAHRLSTVRNADRIVVLERGCIVESGTYEELSTRGRRFRELAQFELT